MNNVIVLGRTTNSIELKQTPSGKPVVTFSLAVKRPFEADTTDFISIVAWGKQAELISKYVKKGDRICVSGFLATRSWEKNGQKHYATEIVLQSVEFCETKTQPNHTDSDHINPDDDLPY